MPNKKPNLPNTPLAKSYLAYMNPISGTKTQMIYKVKNLCFLYEKLRNAFLLGL
jgi:hypothetical protein